MTLISLPTEDSEATIPSPEELWAEFPLSKREGDFVGSSRETISAILRGWDTRLLLIVGPCSIHDLSSAMEYARALKRLQEEVADHFFLVMRTYLEKPRTITGWKGLLYDPDLDESHNMAKGIRLSRKLLVELAQMGVPTGSELLELTTAPYFADCLSWGCIGARTSASPPHRQLASSLSLPVGFKNTTDGSVENAINGIVSASQPHAFLGTSPTGQLARIQTEGNSLCHLVMRGGASGPNYQRVDEAIEACCRVEICDRLVVDCSHDNCGKKPMQQIAVFRSVLERILQGNRKIVGLMLESHLKGGSQPIHREMAKGISITDPCLDWESTEHLIRSAYSQLQQASLCLV